MKHLRSLFDLTPDDVMDILETAKSLKEQLATGDRPPLLSNYMMTQIYDKPSLRTRLSFDTAMVHLGGESAFFTGKDAGLNGRESLPDVVRVASGIADVIVLRTFSQQTVDDFCEWSSCPVINGLTDEYHPCQALTDMFTIREVFGSLNNEHIVFVGDGNNVSASLTIITAMLELPFTLCCPQGYELSDEFHARVRDRYPNANFTLSHNPAEAVANADVVYTDVWASMGQESEADTRKQDFADYQVNAELMSHAPDGCRFMHDLPAKRGLEVTDDVMDGTNSIVFQQAENRMHLAKGLLAWLLKT